MATNESTVDDKKFDTKFEVLCVSEEDSELDISNLHRYSETCYIFKCWV